MKLPADRMSRAEVALRLAHHLAEAGLSTGEIRVAVGDDPVPIADPGRLDVEGFLASLGWTKERSGEGCQGGYRHVRHAARIMVETPAGLPDVVASLRDGAWLRVECKGGIIERLKGDPGYPRLRESLDAALKAGRRGAMDRVGIALPDYRKFRELVERWRRSPLVRQTGALILTVDRENLVRGLEELCAEPVGAST